MKWRIIYYVSVLCIWYDILFDDRRIEDFDYIQVWTGEKVLPVFKKDIKPDCKINDGDTVYCYEDIIKYKDEYDKWHSEEAIFECILKHPVYPLMQMMISLLTEYKYLEILLNTEPFSIYAADRLRGLIEDKKLIFDDEEIKILMGHTIMRHLDTHFPNDQCSFGRVYSSRLRYNARTFLYLNDDIKIEHEETLKHLFITSCNWPNRRDATITYHGWGKWTCNILKKIYDEKFLRNIVKDPIYDDVIKDIASKNMNVIQNDQLV